LRQGWLVGEGSGEIAAGFMCHRLDDEADHDALVAAIPVL
jgi:hypothetical protein